jgi:hypothetical protein
MGPTGSTVKGFAQYWLNMATSVLSTMLALVRSVAVHSMSTFLMPGAMREWCPLITGGRESSVPLASKRQGYTGERSIRGVNLLILESLA